MAELKVRGLDEDVLNRLSALAKSKGYTTREHFLREVLIQLSLDDFQLESDQKYHDFLNRILECLIENDQTIQKSQQLLEQFYGSEWIE